MPTSRFDPIGEALTRHLRALLGRDPQRSDVAIAWSGGADSTALLIAALRALPWEEGAPPLLALHVDHQLRDGSGADAAWCQDTAQALGPGLRLMSLQLPEGPQLAARPGSIEGPARKARYALMGRALRADAPRRPALLTAHHADDNLESLLLALGRGAGLTGLGGIRSAIGLEGLSGAEEDRGIVVGRPLLGLRGGELREALIAIGQRWREDPSNALLDRRRNQLRHQVIPAFLETAQGEAPVFRSLKTLREDRELLEAVVREAFEETRAPTPWYRTGGVALERRRLAALTPLLRRHVVRRALVEAGVEHPPDRASLTRLVEGASRTGIVIEVHGGQVEVEPRLLMVQAGEAGVKAPPTGQVGLEGAPGRATWGEFVLEARLEGVVGRDAWLARCEAAEGGGPGARSLAVLDAGEVEWPLVVRRAGRGERVARFGGGSKALRSLLSDARVARAARPWAAVVCDGGGNVLWVPGVVRTRAALISGDTRELLILSWGPAIADE